MRTGFLVVFAFLGAACSSLPPLDEELSKVSGVSIRRVLDTYESSAETRMVTDRGTPRCEMKVDGGSFETIAAQVWPGVAIDPDSEVPDGCYTIRAVGDSEIDVRNAVARALGIALAVDLRLEQRSRIARELRCPAGKPAGAFRPRAEPKSGEQRNSYTSSGGGKRTQFSWYGNMNDLARIAGLITEQPVTDASGVGGTFEWSGAYDSPRDFERQLAEAGIELAPRNEVHHVLRVTPRPEPE